VLYPLYTDFIETLAKDGLTTRGRLYRNAVDKLSRVSAGDLPFQRYIFVGFNVLSLSEIAIFEKLKALGIADFYWDFNSPVFDSGNNHAIRFLSRNVKQFPSRYDIDTEKITGMPSVDIVGVASKVGQVKVAGELVENWIEEGVIENADNAIDTAIVLPDEFLFIPLIHSLPPSIANVNITMGYPMRHSPIAALMKSIVSMHLRARVVRGKMCYFYEDIFKVLTSPVIKSFASTSATKLTDHITKNRLFTVSVEELLELAPEFKPIFTAVEDVSSVEQVCHYTLALLDYLERKYYAEDNSVEIMFIKAYRDGVMSLKDAATKYKITMRDSTFFQLIERAVGSETVTFIGEPLKGLQIMGVLETRSLNFKNLIMLSMNERVFPRKHFSRSFIPETLRRAYGMSTTEFQESMYAYTFYRLIARCERVTLLYDARTVGGKSAEMSRYLTQLLYLYNKGNITHTISNYTQLPMRGNVIEITKTNSVREKLKRFTEVDGKKLSASSINEYINCGLSFYLKYVEGYKEADELVDYMDFSTYGTVFHDVVEHLYQNLLPEGAPVPKDGILVKVDDIDRLLKDDKLITKLIEEAISVHYYKNQRGVVAAITGETRLLADAIEIFVRAMLEEEKQFCPFLFIGAEHEINARMRINDTLEVNIRQFIDRVDRVNVDRPGGGVLRLVDYKTGSDSVKAKDMDEIFTPGTASKFRPKAFLQLMFYCYAYSGFKLPDEQIQPFIYLMKKIKTNGLKPLKLGDGDLIDYRVYHDEFVQRFNKVIEEIFDPNVTFKQAVDPHSCNFCQFKQICNK
ncbi:MAG: PD-(D/E)XK nuclease family protein, partial [Muribaculaceae bacterium]|nr:PD-(D/E)XK nuclease family protein [Muribaculaceae bacterium]